MKFKIIPNEQTPKVYASRYDEVRLNKDELITKFLIFVRKQHNCAGLAANQVSVDGDRIIIKFFNYSISKF